MENMTTTINEISEIGSTSREINLANMFHILIGVVGVLCNSLTITIVLKFLGTSRLNLFIINQAVIDLITCFWLILYGLNLYWDISSYHGSLGEFMCRFYSQGNNFPLFASFALSTFNLTAMSIERFTAVVYPLKYKEFYKKRNTALMILVVWIVAPLGQYAFPTFRKTTTSDGLCITTSVWNRILGQFFGVFLFIWEFLIPCAIMTFAYAVIIKTLLEQQRRVANVAVVGADNNAVNAKSTEDERRDKARRNVTYTVFTLFLVYICCWTPNQITFLQFNLGGPLDFTGAWYHFTIFIAFCNSFTNTIVYLVRNKQFQNGLKNFVLCRRSTGEDATSTGSTRETGT